MFLFMLAVTNTKTRKAYHGGLCFVRFFLFMLASDWSFCNCVSWYSVGQMAEAARKGEICMKVYALNKVACSVVIIAFAAEKLKLEVPLNEELQTLQFQMGNKVSHPLLSPCA